MGGQPLSPFYLTEMYFLTIWMGCRECAHSNRTDKVDELLSIFKGTLSQDEEKTILWPPS